VHLCGVRHLPTLHLYSDMAILNSSQWDRFISQYPEIHFLQSTAWGELKGQFGWSVERVTEGELGAQILFRSIIPGVTLAYIPKGPIGLKGTNPIGWLDFIKEVDRICRKRHAFLLKIEPDAWNLDPQDIPAQFPENLPIEYSFDHSVPYGFRPSAHNIQPQRTILVSLNEGEENILNRMKQKTRYNIRLAQRSDVKIDTTENLELFSVMIRETGERDQFGVHSQSYYRRFYELFHSLGQCELLQASFKDEPLAMLMVLSSGHRAWYLYGASRNIHREKMPTYLLQWEAMRWAKAHGCTTYDLWGVPDENLETLEAKFTNLSTGLWGVYRFKRGFGGSLFRAAGPWDRVYNPVLFRAYSYWIKRSMRGEIG